jgi:glutamate--cysteine ligase
MTDNVTRTVEKIEQAGIGPALARIHRGIEKESLRINPDGSLSNAPHPPALGSPLTHPYITTDYSEALLEFVTPVCNSVPEVLQSLYSIHQFVLQNIAQEHLWVASMPCILGGEEAIPIARYGSSNIGQMKHVYRRGLARRYGRTMQSIAGIHFNFSIDDEFWRQWQKCNNQTASLRDFKSSSYFGLLRNFYRVLWVVLYLYGASPAVCKTFVDGREHPLKRFGHGTFFLPHATSLRMGNMGYQSAVQSSIQIELDDVNGYCESLLKATKTVYPKYQEFGIKTDDQYRQLNANLLQIENEYYAPVRPKRVARSGEKPTSALRQRGVEYIEVRSIDLDPFLPVGIDESGIKFLELLLIGCLFDDSPPLGNSEMARLRAVQDQIVLNGRDPNITIVTEQGEQTVADVGANLLLQLTPLAELLDSCGETGYRQALTQQKDKFVAPELTPSARILEIMRDRDISFFQFAMEQSLSHQQLFQNHTLTPEENRRFVDEAQYSIQCQQALEAADSLPFDQFLKQYFSD